MVKLKNNLRQLIEEQYVTIIKFSKQHKLNSSYISTIIKRQVHPTMTTQIKLAKLLKVSVDDLFYYDD